MRWTTMRRDFLFAMVVLSATSCLAADSYLSGFSTDNAGMDYGQPAATLSNSGIDRLLEVNATHDSLLRTSSRSTSAVTQATSDTSALEITPIADVTPNGGSGLYLAAGCLAAFAMGLGLCFAGMMTGRKRTINTFTAGFVRIR